MQEDRAGWDAGITELIPEEAALVGHGRALRLPEEEARVGEELVRHERQHARPVRVAGAQHLAHFGEHGHELLVDVVVAALRQEAAHLLAHLLLVQVPAVLVVGARTRRRVRSTYNSNNQ